jgi:AraC-like DNA-binding protein
VVAHIRRHLADPTLRTSTLARALGISSRSVQGVFERLTTTASAFILEARLQRAVERLTADRYASITELAFECGFSDSGYFSRCFREHFGLSPRDYRRHRRASAPVADSMAE